MSAPKRSTCLALLACAALGVAAAPAGAAPPEIRDVSREAGIFNVAHTWSAEVGDLDGDGWDDLLVPNHYEGENPVDLYRNDRDGTFSELDPGAGAFPKRDRHDCAFGDVDRDGREDIYCTIGGGRGLGRNPNELYLQQADGTFVNEAGEWGVKDLNGRGRDVTFIDVDEDGYLDLYVGNKFPRRDSRRSKNKLYLNVDGERFETDRSYGLNRQIGGRTIQRVDADRDGWDDLLVCGERRVFLFRNLRGRRFNDVLGKRGIREPCEAALLTKINGGGRPDLVTLSKTRLKVRLQARRNRFADPRFKLRVRRAVDVAAGRVDRDQRSDLYVVQSGKPDRDRPDRLLINKRRGREFKDIRIPQTRRGKGDFVTTIDHDRNGLDDFVVLNGSHKHPGPVRLLASYR